MSTNMSNVQKFYAGKTIFVTGGTGFLGQILLHKLLCSCPELRRIYVLIRPKKKDCDLRLEKLFDQSIFKSCNELHCSIENKIKLIRGDCCEDRLGISHADQLTIENEVDIIFHIAATVNFNGCLRESAQVNISSLDYLLDVAKRMRNLKARLTINTARLLGVFVSCSTKKQQNYDHAGELAFGYVSTVLSPSTETQFIEEKFYNPPIKARELSLLMKLLDDEILKEITPRIIGSYQNSYVYTKSIAEDLCRDKGSQMPLYILRPSSVTPCYKEPVAGWINNLYTFVGVMYAYALGILKVFHTDRFCKAHICPGDYTINALIVSAYYTNQMWENKTALELKFDIPVINYSKSSSKSILTWEDCYSKMKKGFKKYPFYNIFTLPSLILTKNIITYQFLRFILHRIPASIADIGLMIMGKPPRFLALYRKIDEFANAIEFWGLKDWTVKNSNVNKIWSSASKEDKIIFNFNLDDIDFEQYFEIITHGIRLYLAKENDSTIDEAKRRHQRFFIFYCIVIVAVLLIFLYFLMYLL